MRHADALLVLDRDLRAIFGERMLSLVSYGTMATGEAPVASLAVVRALTPVDLRACAERLSHWHRQGLATPLVLQAGEFARSLDAFPFEFGAILADHVSVSGVDPFMGLAVDPADLRRACEVQARSHLLHLREGYMETHGRTDQVATLIVRSAPALAALLSHIERLMTALSPRPVLARVAELAPQGTLSPDEAHRIFPDYLAAIEALTVELDRWSSTS